MLGWHQQTCISNSPGALLLLDFGLEMLQGFRESKLQKVSQPMEMWQERTGDPG